MYSREVYPAETMKRILVCLDASTRAPFVLQTATELAQKMGAKLVLLRSVGLPAEIDQEFYVHAATSMTEMLVQKAKSDLDVLSKGVPAGLIEGYDVHIGTPWDTICREAKARDSDLVVLGSHGYSGMDRVLGTTAAKVVNHCEVSVLVVRSKAA
jgi:nucleotide-binding universal stress UspA family protein